MTTNEYIRHKVAQRGLTQIDIAKAIAAKSGHEKDYNLYKGIVNKWFKTDQEPGKAYLLTLSEILNVSVESILRGEDSPSDIGTRPTAYAAAKSGDPYIIERLFGNPVTDVRVYTSDEYGNSFLDYVMEFRNLDALRIAIQKGYFQLWKYQKNDELHRLRPMDPNETAEFEVAKMIVEADDLELFQMMFDRMAPIFDYQAYREKYHYAYYSIPHKLTEAILKTKRILAYLLESTPIPDREWNSYDISRGLVIESKEDEKLVRSIPSVAASFNDLLQIAIKLQLNDTIDQMLDAAIKHWECVLDILEDDKSRFWLTLDGTIAWNGMRRGHFAYMPVIKDAFVFASPELLSKAKALKELQESISFFDAK